MGVGFVGHAGEKGEKGVPGPPGKLSEQTGQNCSSIIPLDGAKGEPVSIASYMYSRMSG